MALKTLKRRADFVRLKEAVAWATPAFVMQAARRPSLAIEPPTTANRPVEDSAAARRLTSATHRQLSSDTAEARRNKSLHPGNVHSTTDGARFGFTVTKRIGNAVVRNRARRRLREAVRQLAPTCAADLTDYVLIARQGALKRPFAILVEDLRVAFMRVHRKLDKPVGAQSNGTGNRASGRSGRKHGRGRRGTKTGGTSANDATAKDIPQTCLGCVN